jgi:GMP synthase (glutamine-hydrolysing)
MIVYIGFAQRDERTDWAGTYARHAARFERASGRDCLVVQYDLVSPELMARLRPQAVVMSGFARSFEEFAPGAFVAVAEWLIHADPVPTLAICGAHQLLGFVFGAGLCAERPLRDQPMRLLRTGEAIVNPDYHPEHFMERGFYELDVKATDPLFSNCGHPPVMAESHYCEVKELPPGFRLLASTPECGIQAMRHETRALIGVQFHPEDYTERFPDGRHFLEAFFREATTCGTRNTRGAF